MQNANVAYEINDEVRDLSLKDVERYSPFYWAEHNHIMLPAGPYSIKNHEYQVDILNAREKIKCAKKGAQLGITESEVLSTLHGLIFNRYTIPFVVEFVLQID